MIIPTLGEITNPPWHNAQWRGAEYNPLDSRASNGFFSGTSVDGVWTGTIALPKRVVLDNCALRQSGQHDEPGFAAELQTALRAGITQATGAEGTNITVANNTSQASLYVTSPTHPLRIYSAELLRDARWVGEVWHSPANDRHGPALTSDPMDINRKLAPPQTFGSPTPSRRDRSTSAVCAKYTCTVLR